MRVNVKYIIAAFLAVMLFSCGKYGYDFQDGWQEGDKEGINPEDSSLTYVDKSKYDKARIFPGLVGSSIKRAQDTSITLDLNYRDITIEDLKVWQAPQPIFSVGLYAPAGENVKIVVPDGAEGLMVQIGPHEINLGWESVQYRDPIVTTYKALFPGVNYIRNPYGGIIWIRSKLSFKNPINLRFSNVVRTSDFIYGKSNQEEWLKDVEANDVPWLELRSKRVVFTVPRSLVLQYKNDLKINEALDKWTKLYEEDVYKWMGLTANNPDKKNSFPDLPERATLDIQLPRPEYGYAEVPWVGYMDKYWFGILSNATDLTSSMSSAWSAYHVVGHNYQMWAGWNWQALHQTTSNLFVFKAAQRLGISQNSMRDEVKRIILNSLNFALRTTKKNFNDGYNDGEDGYHRLAPFLQIFEKVKGKNGESGWDFFAQLFYTARNSNYYFGGFDEAKMDYFYRELCQFTGVDYARFMDAWGIKISLTAKRDMRKIYPPLTKAIWKYNPLTNTGGDEGIELEYDLHASDFVWTSNMPTATNESIGTIKAVSDGNTNTYWHTCYDKYRCDIEESKYTGISASPEAPTYLDLDMQELKTISGVYLQNRPGETYRRGASVYTKDSPDGKWEKQGEIILAISKDDPDRDSRKQFKFPDIIQTRYIRFEFAELNYNNDAHTAIAEAGAFYSPN